MKYKYNQYDWKREDPIPVKEKTIKNSSLVNDLISMAEQSGLKFTGEFEGSEPQFIGDQQSWDKFDKLNICAMN